MAASKEARLIMRLVDHVTRPAAGIARSLGVVDKAVSGFGTGAMAPTRAIGNMARSARRATGDVAGLSAGLSFGIGAAAKQFYDYTKEGNTIEAVAMATAEQRRAMEQYAQILNADFPASNTEILGGMRELARAGMDVEQIMGGIRETLNFALAGDFPIAESGDFLTNMLSAFRLPKDTEEQVNTSMKRVSDTIAWAANKSNADVQDLAVSMRYVAPLGPVTNQSIEEMASMLMVLADNGIKASNAGTGIRWALMSLISPTEGALAAFEKMNINLGDFITGSKKIDAPTLIKNLALDGIDATGMEDSIQRILDDPRMKLSPAKLAATITDQLGDALAGEGGLVDKEVLLKSLNENLSLLGTEVDFLGLLDKLRDTPGAEAFFGDIFGKRHAVKIMAALADVNGTLDTLVNNYEGAADRMSRVRLKGVVGAWEELTAAVENTGVAFGNSGLAEDAIRLFAEMAKGLQAVAKSSPDLLRLAGYGALALAVLGPLGLAAGGAAAALALMVNPLALVVGSLAALVALNFSAVKDFFSVFGSSFKAGLSPEIVDRFREVTDAVKDFFAIDWGSGDRAEAIGQIARNMGLGLAAGVNTAWASIGRLKEIGAAIQEFVTGAWAENGSRVAAGIEQFKQALVGFVMPKVDGFRDLATAFVDFAEQAEPYLGPVLTKGIDLVAGSFNTMASGAAALSRVIGGVTEGVVAFATAFLEKIDGPAMQATANGFSAAMDFLRSGLGPIQQVFNAINVDFAEFAGWAGGKLGEAVSSIIRVLSDLGSYVPDFGPLIGTVSNAIGTIVSTIERIIGAVERASGALSSLSGMGSGVGAIGAFGSTAAGAGSANADPFKAIMPGDQNAATGPGRRKASGGAISPGLTYLVGEQGPEPITVGRNSYVTPNHRLGGARETLRPASSAANVTNNFHNQFKIDATDPKAAANEIAGILQRQLNRSTQISLEDRSVI